ncbi:hypothetical protein C0V76_14640 [Uliginosibacterium sp. TH139]|nr:hypothetical protein C0V76_14640 [Uliginosibacterium sp. TH139]
MLWRKAEAEWMVCLWWRKPRRDQVGKYLALAAEAVSQAFVAICWGGLLEAGLRRLLEVLCPMQAPDERGVQPEDQEQCAQDQQLSA